MSTSTITDSTAQHETERAQYPRWQTVLFWAGVVALFVLALGMRLYDLGLPFDRDGYDEGVYWASLRAMSAGHTLYGQIFYSQPPFFLLSIFPGFALFGGTLWSARLGIALMSLFGALGAFLLGKALSGRIGAMLALLLIVVDQLYLVESQKLMAEAPSVAFSLLAVGLAFLWWEQSQKGRAQAPALVANLRWYQSAVLATLTGITLALSVLSKLLCLAAFIPVVLLMLARLWQIWQKQPGTRKTWQGQVLRSIFAGILAFLVTMLVILLPFLGSFHSLLQELVNFHTQSASVFGRGENKTLIEHVLFTMLGLAALYGAAVALLWHDWRVIPLGGWLLGTAFFLWRLVPLFPHHLGALIPPMIGLAIMGIRKTPISEVGRGHYLPPGQGPVPGGDSTPPLLSKVGATLAVALLHSLARVLEKVAMPVAILLVLLTTAIAIQQDSGYYRTSAMRSNDALARQEAHIVADLRQVTTPDEEVVTDAQFIADLAKRNTPPSLVDTSMVRITGGDLTLQQLIAATSQPQVHAVLFFSGRFYLRRVRAFHDWVAQHFHLLHTYGPGMELWVR